MATESSRNVRICGKTTSNSKYINQPVIAFLCKENQGKTAFTTCIFYGITHSNP